MNKKPIKEYPTLCISEDENIIILTLPDGTKERHEAFLHEGIEILCGPGKCSLANKGICPKVPCISFLRKDGLEKGFKLIKED